MAYKFLSQLSETAWIVEDFKTSSTFVMKKVECGDEMEANELFHKMAEHQKLNHPFIVPFHHLFVSWNEDRAVCLSIVSKHMSEGSLSQLLARQRENCQWIEKTVLQKWIGQLIEALVFIHRHHLCHRRLKSSNIYRTDGGDSLCIGDQAPNLNTCITQSSLNWFPPETITPNTTDSDSSYDERSDIWSLGCVFLEMATTGCINSTEFLSNLFQLKVNPCVLDDLLSEISSQYDEELTSLIQTMLRQSYHQRPLAIDLCDIPYVRTCLSLYNSTLLEELTGLTYEQSIIAAKLRKSKFSINTLLTVLDDLIVYLQQNTGDQRVPLNSSLGELILECLSQYKRVPNLVVKCFNVLYLSSGYNGDRKDDITLLTAGVLQIHLDQYTVVKSGVQLLVSMSIEDSVVINMITLGLPNLTLKLAESFTEAPDILYLTFVLLTNLIKPKAVLDAAVRGKMVDLVCRALLNHSNSSSLVVSGLTLLWTSMSSDDALMIMCTPSYATLISKLIDLHKEDMMVVKIGLGLLALLCRTKEDICYSLVDGKITPNGLSVLIEIIRCQHYNPDVLEQTLLLIAELTKYDDIQEELIQCNVAEFLSDCMTVMDSSNYYSKELKDQVKSVIAQLLLQES